MTAPEELLRFWLDEVGPAKWYIHDPALDSAICEEFMGVWEQAMEGKFSLWLTYPSGALAYCILLDQFSRNMFRDTPRSFASDLIACAAAKAAISKGWDMKIDGLARQFFYMPLMHSESLSDQDRCVRLIRNRMPDQGAGNLLHARAYREVIRLFGRFPTRNEILSRANTPAEQAFLDDGGYRMALTAVSEEQTA